jgi:UBX domain-containing protein 1
LPGQPVQIKVSQRTEEEYQPPVKKPSKFQGGGNRLGAIVPLSPTSDPFALPGSFPTPVTPVIPGKITITAAMAIDQTKPVTSIQIRLADGTRMVAKFNHSHTIGDIRQYIRASRPEYSGARFALQTPLPIKIFEDDKVVISDAGLLNAVVVQRLLI